MDWFFHVERYLSWFLWFPLGCRFMISRFCLWKEALSDNFNHFLSSFDHHVLSFQMQSVFSILCHFWIGLLVFQNDVVFRELSIFLSSLGVPWGPCYRRGSCKVGQSLPASMDPSLWNIRTSLSIIRKFFVEGDSISVFSEHLFEEVQKWGICLIILKDSDGNFIGKFLLKLWWFQNLPYFSKTLFVIYEWKYSTKRL